MVAARYAHIECAQLLVAAGADVNARDAKGATALMQLAAENRTAKDSSAAFRVLVAAGADIDCENNAGETAFMIAARRNSRPMILALHKKGADIEHRNKDGETAFHLACVNGIPDTVSLLLDLQVDGKAKDNAGKTGYQRAKDTGWEKMYWHLQKLGYGDPKSMATEEYRSQNREDDGFNSRLAAIKEKRHTGDSSEIALSGRSHPQDGATLSRRDRAVDK